MNGDKPLKEFTQPVFLGTLLGGREESGWGRTWGWEAILLPCGGMKTWHKIMTVQVESWRRCNNARRSTRWDLAVKDDGDGGE